MSLRAGLSAVEPTPSEVSDARPGDALVPRPVVVMDRGFTLDAPPARVWPWLVQLGKARAGWYLPRAVERLLPVGRRASRVVEQRWQTLEVGSVIPDYGGAGATFEVAELVEPAALVYRSRRGSVELSWAIVLTAEPGDRTRVHLRLRLGPVKRVWLARSVGGGFDLATIAGMAAGLAERLADEDRLSSPSAGP